MTSKRNVKSTVGYVSLGLALAFVLGAIWTSYHWQAGATALVFLLTAAALLGAPMKTTPPKDDGPKYHRI